MPEKSFMSVYKKLYESSSKVGDLIAYDQHDCYYIILGIKKNTYVMLSLRDMVIDDFIGNLSYKLLYRPNLSS